VDYLKDKELLLKQIKHKISDDVYNVLCGQFAGDRGKKEASKVVRRRKENFEEKRKRNGVEEIEAATRSY
jgi:translation initiation factor IF-2